MSRTETWAVVLEKSSIGTIYAITLPLSITTLQDARAYRDTHHPTSKLQREVHEVWEY